MFAKNIDFIAEGNQTLVKNGVSVDVTT